MSPRHAVCSTTDLPPGAVRVEAVGNREVLVLNVDGDLIALDAVPKIRHTRNTVTNAPLLWSHLRGPPVLAEQSPRSALVSPP